MKFRVNAFLWLIYRFLQGLSWVGVHVFFKKRLLLGSENLRFEGPAIVIVNHPNTLMDVLVPGISIRQTMFYLANYGLFKNPVSGWILRRLFCIPVKRREDVAEGEARNNDNAFEASFQHMERGGVLFVAAEGVSWMNRFVRPLKTGAARIALRSEARNDWQLGVKIIPIGLSYSAPNKFRSTVVCQVGAPVFAGDWREPFERDPEAAFDSFTQHLENQLKNLSIHARDEAGEQFITRLEEVLANEKPLPLRGEFERTQSLVGSRLDDLELREKTDSYFSDLKKSNLTDLGVAAFLKKNSLKNHLYDFSMLLLGAPFTLAAGLFWFVACYPPAWLTRKMQLYVGYDSTVKFLAGIFSLPLAAWVAFQYARYFGLGDWQAPSLVFLLVLMGFHLEATELVWRRFVERRKVVVLAGREADFFKNLMEKREDLLASLGV